MRTFALYVGVTLGEVLPGRKKSDAIASICEAAFVIVDGNFAVATAP
jgi:hypothetical protein